MKKAFPYIVAIGVGLVALYAVYHFRTTRLMPQQLEEMRESSQRLEDIEQSERSEGALDPASTASSSDSDASLDQLVTEVPSDQLPDEAPDTYHVAFETSEGTFVVECHKDWAPNGVQRFYELVKMGFYDDIRIFRVVTDFVAQFGISNDPELNEKWMESTIPDDPVTQSNTRGRLTFAAGSRPNSRSTQVFINLASNAAHLDSRGFAPFGEVVRGMNVVDQFYSGYGESITQMQQQIAASGNALLDSQFPKLTAIERAFIATITDDPSVEGGEEAAMPEDSPAAEALDSSSDQ